MVTVWDARWSGNFGIGRFAREVRERLSVVDVDISDRSVMPATVRDPVRVASHLRASDANLFVTPGFNASASRSVRQLLTIHDLIHLDARYASISKRLYYRHVVRPAVLSAGSVITVSESSRRAIQAWAGPEVRVFVAPNGCSLEVATSPVRKGNYMLFVGNEKPHKNYDLLVKAMRYTDRPLQTVGISPDYSRQLAVLHGIALDRFTHHAGITDDELKGLYARAACLVFPSSLEGFGLPALEAMSQGSASVYVCDAVGDVVGTTGCRVEASPESIAWGVDQVAEGLAGGFAELVGRAQTFSWNRTATVVEEAIVWTKGKV